VVLGDEGGDGSGGTAGVVDGDAGGMNGADVADGASVMDGAGVGDGAGVVDGAGIAAGTGVAEGAGVAYVVDGTGAGADRDGVADSVVTVGDGAGGRCRC